MYIKQMEAVSMINVDDRFDVRRVVLSAAERSLSEKPGTVGDIEAFMAVASVANVPVEVVRCKRGDKEAMPLSNMGKTHVRFVGNAPVISVDTDVHGNLLMVFTGPSVVEAVFNSVKENARGRNRGAHGHKKIYICE